MQKVGDAVSKIDICHMKSPAHNAQHGVWTLCLHRNNNKCQLPFMAQDKSES